MTAPALTAAQEGVRYQYRFFWRMALPMLYLDTPRKVIMEHRGVDAVDDVVVDWADPGVADGGGFVKVDFHQIKFHVSQGNCVSSADLIDPTWTGTRQSMLWRFAAAWKSLREKEPAIRLSLVTNWPWCAHDPIARLIRDDGKISNSFFEAGPGSRIGKIRRSWREHLSALDELEYKEFVRQLRLCAGAVSQSEAGEWLADRCELAGLQRPDLSKNHSPYDDLAGRLLAAGQREFTGGDLRSIVKQEGLIAQESQPFRSTCAVRSFRRFAHEPRTDAAVVVDLTDLFDGRHIVNESAWREVIPQRLEHELLAVSGLPTPIEVALDAHLSIAWYAGTILDGKAGLPILLRQKSTLGVELWDTREAKTPNDQAWVMSETKVGGGPDLAVALSVTHDVFVDVQSAVRTLVPTAGTLVHARLPELGASAVRGGGHAVALATELATRLREHSREKRASRTHLFAACPASLAFLLGQRSAAVGPMTLYEYDFGRGGTYSPALAT